MALFTYTAGTLVAESQLANLVIPAYDQVFEWKLRSQPIFRQWVDKRPVSVTNSGDSVTFSFYSDLAVATTPLSENVTPDPVPLGNPTRVTVTLNEYGNLALETLRINEVAFNKVDSAVANTIAFNVVDTMDSLVQTTMQGGNQVSRRGGGALGYVDPTGATIGTAVGPTAITGSDVIKSDDIRAIVARMRTNKVQPRIGQSYLGAIHPMVSADLRKESGAGSFRDPHVYNDTAVSNLWDGVVGQYEGVVFVENPRCYNAQLGAGSGATQTRVFQSWFLGAQAIAEAVNVEPHIVAGAITDPLKRFMPLGWHAFLGWGIFRQEALYRYECAASNQPNQ